MENTGVLNANLRTSTRKGDNNQLKRDGYLIGNIVGKGLESIAISVRKDEFTKFMKKTGRNSVFNIAIADGKSYTVMIKDINYESMKNQIIHLDFQVVSLTEKIKQEVSIKFTGMEMLEAKGLLINSSVDSVIVEGFPQDVPDEIVIDIAHLNAGEGIQFSDIKLPEGITSNFDPDQKVVTVVNSKMPEEEAAVDEEETAESTS